MASSWQRLGAIIGGAGEQRQEDIYADEYLDMARTDEALARARIKRDEALARQALGDAVTRAMAGDDTALATLMRAGMGNWQQVTAGRGNIQEQAFRETIADPDTPMPARQYAAQAVSGRPVNFLDNMGSGQYTDIRNPEAGVQTGALGDAVIDLRRAQTESEEAQTAYRQERTRNPERFRSPASQTTPGERAARILQEGYARYLAEEASSEADMTGDPAAAFQDARARLGELITTPNPIPAPGAGAGAASPTEISPELAREIEALRANPDWEQKVREDARRALERGANLEDVMARVQTIIELMDRQAAATDARQ